MVGNGKGSWEDSKGGFVATSIIRDSSSSAIALVLAYALVVLSLWKVDTGLAGRRLTAFGGNDAVATSLVPPNGPAESSSELYRLLVATNEQSGVSPAGDRTEAQNEEVRRLTALSLMLYVTADVVKK
jgi:hypothetical protein